VGKGKKGTDFFKIGCNTQIISGGRKNSQKKKYENQKVYLGKDGILKSTFTERGVDLKVFTPKNPWGGGKEKERRGLEQKKGGGK